MFTTTEELEAKPWQRLLVIRVEDIGYGQLDAPIPVYSLFKMYHNFSRLQADRY